ncbi:hypothetical protein ABIA46_001149 [Pseudomonas aeruginosa]
MQIDLSDKLAIVSGSTAGIGFAIASGLAAAGATVVVNGRSQAAVDRAIAAIRNGQPDARVRGVAGDLGTAEGCAAFVAAEPKADILVNNLGIFELKDFFDIEDAEWSRFFEVNVMSGVRLARAYVPGMVERGWGRVVFLSSESALNIPADMIHYGFSKTANLSVSRGPGQAPGRHRGDGECGAARTNPHRRRRRDAPRGCAEGRAEHRRGRHRLCPAAPFQFDHPAPGDARGSRQPGGLHLLDPGLGDHRRGPAGRRRGARQPGLTSAQRQRKNAPRHSRRGARGPWPVAAPASGGGARKACVTRRDRRRRQV